MSVLNIGESTKVDLRPTEVINLRIYGLMVKPTESKSLDFFFQSPCRHVCTSTGKPILFYLCPLGEVISICWNEKITCN